MKRTLLLIVIAIAAVTTINAQGAPDASALTSLLNEFLAGAGHNDAAVHDRFWADDLIYTRSSGVRTNKEEIMKGLRSAPAPKPGDPVTVYSAEDIQIHQYGNAAVVAFRLVGNTTKSDGTKTVINNFNTGTFIKRNGKWQAVAWQSTIIPEPKATAQASAADTKAASPGSGGSTTTATPTTAPGTRVYQKGTKGGCYYLNPAGSKVYVSHDLCK